MKGKLKIQLEIESSFTAKLTILEVCDEYLIEYEEELDKLKAEVQSLSNEGDFWPVENNLKSISRGNLRLDARRGEFDRSSIEMTTWNVYLL